MNRIDFYSLKEGSGGDRFLLTCRLVERIHGDGHRIFVYLASQDEARHLDRLLWTYRQQSFLPHGMSGEVDEELTPILIGQGGEPGGEDQVLINLAREVPAFFERFQRLAEPIDHDPAVRSAGRERYRYYRDRGFPLHHHQVEL